MAVNRWKSKPAYSLKVIMLACLSVLAVPWTAAAAERPPKKVCAQTDAFDRLVCRQGALADQVQYTAESVFAPETKLHEHAGEARLKALNDAKTALRQREGKLTKEHFRRQAKAGLVRGNKDGHLVPLTDRDDQNPRDGICDYEQGDSNAKCAAIEVGPSGDLQACNPVKKNKGGGKDGLECDLVDATDAADEAEMKESAAHVDAIYDTVEDELIGMNDTLDQVNAGLKSRSARVALLTATAPCTFWFFPNEPLPDSWWLKRGVGALRATSIVVSGVARVYGTYGNQVIGGFNASVTRWWWETGALVANTVYVIAEEALKATTDDQGSIKECLTHLATVSAASSGSLADLQKPDGVLQQTLARIDGMEASIGRLETGLANLQKALQEQHQQIMARDDENRAKTVERVEETRWDIIQLLNTPQGQRSDFPIK